MQKRPKRGDRPSPRARPVTGGLYDHEPLPDRFALRTRDFYLMDDSPIVSLHYHDITELGYCHEGSGVFVVGSKILPFSAGDVSLVSPGEMHLAQSHRGTRSLWTFVFLDFAELLLPRFPELASFDITAYAGESFRNIVPPGDPRLLNEAVRALIMEIRHKKPLHRVVILSHLAMVAARLSRGTPRAVPTAPAARGRASRKSVSPLKAALEHIARTYYAPIRIPELARLCGMSERNFTRRFTEAIGSSPHRYVTDTRVAMASGQLVKTDAPVAIVAEDSGFLSLSSFNRAFKARTGVSPREWRRTRAAAAGLAGGRGR